MGYGQQGICALAVGPAYIKTGLENCLPEATRNASPGMRAVGRMGESREVADLIVWRRSDRASFRARASIPVDGDYLAP